MIYENIVKEALSLADAKPNLRTPMSLKKKPEKWTAREVEGNARKSVPSCFRGCFASIKIRPFFPVGPAQSPFVFCDGTYPSFDGVIYKSLQHEGR